MTPDPTNRYVVGFMFSKDYEQVALISKQKPEWQKGLLNGIGGKVEPGEKLYAAMIREFKEETGLETTAFDWSWYAELVGDLPIKNATVACFVTTGDLTLLKSTTSEQIEIISVRKINPLRNLDMIENLPWLIALAIDHHGDGRPHFTTIRY